MKETATNQSGAYFPFVRKGVCTMVKEDPKNVRQSFAPKPAPKIDRALRITFGVLLVLGVGTLFAVQSSSTTGLLMAERSGPAEGTPTSAAAVPVTKPAQMIPFQTWPAGKNPEFVLFLSGEMHGYINPCGCSSPQYGGLARRFNIIQDLKTKRGWRVVPVDLGDLFEDSIHQGPQAQEKYLTTMHALRSMGYVAVGLGENETVRGLLNNLALYALNWETPSVLTANITDKQKNWANTVHNVAYDNPVKPVVGITSIVGPVVAKKMAARDPACKFEDTPKVLPAVLKEMASKKVQFRVLLYQGTVKEAEALAKAFPQFDVIQCLSKDSEPPATPFRVNGSPTLIITVGHKGRYVGVVGAFASGKPNKPYNLHYELIHVSDTYETPKDKKKEKENAALVLLEEYTQKLQQQKFLDQYPQQKHPVQMQFPKATYVGTEACKKCHETQYKVWAKSKHAHAYETLVKRADRPSLRQFDGECIVCHTVGFGQETGFKNLQDTPHLINVGCESCHGPGSIHAKGGPADPKQKAVLLSLMNPFQPKKGETPQQTKQRLLRLDTSCTKCHDPENDIPWELKKRWKDVVHRDPVAPQPAPPANK